MAIDYLDELREQQFPDPPSVARIAALALQAQSLLPGTFALPVIFYSGAPPHAANRFYFDSNVAISGFNSIFTGLAALSPGIGNYTLAAAEDQSELSIGGGFGQIVMASPLQTLTTLLCNGGIFQDAGSFIAGDGQAWQELVSSPIDLSAGGTITLDPAEYTCPMLQLSGTLAADTIVVFPDQPGAVWDIEANALDTNSHSLTFQCGAATVPIALGEINLLGCRAMCVRPGVMTLAGAPYT